MEWQNQSSDSVALMPEKPDELRIYGIMASCARASCICAPRGVTSWKVCVLELGEEAGAWVEVGVALQSGDNSDGNTLSARYQGGGDLGSRSCGQVRVGEAFALELDMNRGKFVLSPPRGEPIVWEDKEEAAFTGVGQICGQLWQPFIRVRPGKQKSSSFRLESFKYIAPMQDTEEYRATIVKASLLGHLEKLCKEMNERGGLGPGMGDIQCVIPAAGQRGALYISGGFAANEKNFDALQVGAILRLGSFKYAVKDGIEVLSVDIGDNQDVLLTPHIEGIVHFQEKNLRCGRNVLVHCGAGVSRSGASIIAFLMWKDGINFAEALAFVKKRRQWVHPNSGFESQLKKYPFADLRL